MERYTPLRPKYSIEQDYLGEFLNPVNYDVEENINVGDHHSRHFYADLAQQAAGPVLELDRIKA